MLFLIFGLYTGYISVDRDYTVHMEMDKLNEGIGFSRSFKDEQWGWSWSLLAVENNMAVGVKMLKGTEIMDLDSLSLSLSFDTKLVELGYANNLSRFIFFLSAGGGLSSIALKSVIEEDSIDFPISLSNPEGSVSYKGSSYVLSASTGLLMIVSDYLGAGVSAGYVYGLRTPKLVLEGKEDVEIQNAPEMPLHQWYVKFSVVMGNFANLLK
jgi:hypothetical protein